MRPMTAAAAFGGLVGLAVGCAYLGGTVAKTTTTRIQAERIAGATAVGFTEEALSAAAGGMDASALTIARRHDPYTVAGAAQRDRQSEMLTARLESLRANSSTEAGNAVAYTMLWAQESMSERETRPAAESATEDAPASPRAQTRPQAAPASAQSVEDDAAA